MKSIKKTITIADLNAGSEIEIDVTILDENGDTKIPQEILIINNTGTSLGILYIDDDAEKVIRENNPAFFDFIPIDTGKSNGVLPSSIEYVVIDNLSGTATADLEFYLIAYY